MKKYIAKIASLILTALALFVFCSCQTDFSKPADYTLDVNGGANIFIPELTAIDSPGDSQTVVFEIKNSGKEEKAYTLKVTSLGTLPLSFALESDQATATGAEAVGTVSGGTAHRYTLTVSWPAEENDYKYAGQTDEVSVGLKTE